MSHQPVIDGFEFAAAGAVQQGVLPIGSFPRLRDMLASAEGDVAYALQGARDGRGRPSLRLKVDGALKLRCQRCLDALQFEVHTASMLVLAASQAEIDADPADANAPDRVLGSKEMKVKDLVEDELILAVPYAPRHERCVERPEQGDEFRSLPFSGLKGLMGGKH